jgi:cytochrome c peroxidase
MRCILVIIFALATWMLVSCRSSQPKPESHPESEVISNDEPIKPIPTKIDLDTRKVALGKLLFNEVKLSRDNTISCASCHDLEAGGVDHRVHSIGIGGAEGGINAPTVFNAALNFR